MTQAEHKIALANYYLKYVTTTIDLLKSGVKLEDELKSFYIHSSRAQILSDHRVKAMLKSYINIKLIRFLAFISCTSQNINNETTWRFVSDPSNFDHIFTDEELYKKYNLTEKEITIIESVIKERK